jgi:ABC-2 type transport system permease protein
MDPNDTLVIIGSYFPFFSPIVTFSRVVLGEASLPEIIGSIGLLVFTILVMSYFANRIYLNGVMKYNNKTSIKDVLAMAKRKQ